jgi:hypothetical protein
MWSVYEPNVSEEVSLPSSGYKISRHGFIFQEIAFITTAVRTTNPTEELCRFIYGIPSQTPLTVNQSCQPYAPAALYSQQTLFFLLLVLISVRG